MNIINDAISHEKEMKIFFYISNELINNLYLKNLFDYFSNESKKHCKILENAVAGKKYRVFSINTYYLGKEIMNHLDNSAMSKLEGNDLKQIDMAINQKKESQRFYLKKIVDDKLSENIKDIFLNFADDEYTHLTLLDYIKKNSNKSVHKRKAHIISKAIL